MRQVLKIVLFACLIACFFVLAGITIPDFPARGERGRVRLVSSWVLGFVAYTLGAGLAVWGDVYARYRDELASPTAYRIIGSVLALLGLGWALGLKSFLEWSAK